LRQNAVKTVLFSGSLAIFGYGVLATPFQAQSGSPSHDVSAVFESKIRPALEANCVACHGPKQHSGGVRLDHAISADVAQRLVEAIAYTGEVKMPPSGKLPAEQLAALTAWAKAGAPWPVTPKATGKSKGKFWSFVAPKTPALPKVKAEWWAKNPIDRLILAKLEEKGLKPAPVADRRTLIRRATFDLTGLPPTPLEIDAFLADTQPNAFERVIDRLLASPAYGERWGRHWLDVARYSDSNGLDENLVYPNAWRYRDYVIGAFNSDKPIDRFFQEQLAGDLLPGAGDNEIVATGYLSLGGKMLAEDDPVKQELDIIDEQIDTTTKTFLGLTVGCARCHDHKFDPIPSKDYYSLAGIFKSTKTMLNFKNMAEWNERPLGDKANQEKLATIEAQLKVLRDSVNKKRDAASEALLKDLRPRKATYEVAARRLLAADAKKAELHPVITTPSGTAPPEAIVHEAEDFTSGNVNKDLNGFGVGIGVLVNHGEYPNRAEYDISVPTDGPYQLDLRYASGDSRPIRVYANGDLVLSNAAGEVTGGFYPKDQKWFAEGTLLLHAGVNHLKFERDSYFPHIDKFLFVSRPSQVPTESLDAIAKQDGLIPEVITIVADKVKSGVDVSIELPDNPDHLFPAPVAQELKGLDDEISKLEKSKPDVPKAMAVSEGRPTTLKVHLRGNYLTLGEECPRGFPSVITDAKQPPVPANHSGRLEFAQWMTDSRNPLTARVFVNRVWRWKFGRGIVASVDNFGTLGDLPTHPELLDWLATTFVKQDGWSLKKFQKRLMLTNTYMMSGKYDQKDAVIDSDNHYLWRFPRQRLEAESIRDSILFVAPVPKARTQ
jgi:cytochrome c553